MKKSRKKQEEAQFPIVEAVKLDRPFYVYIFGWAWHDDLKFGNFELQNNVVIYSGPTINGYAPKSDELYQALTNASSCDLVIVAGFGTLFEQHFQKIILDDPTAYGIWEALSKKVYWSFDSHHEWHVETGYKRHFNRMYIAHDAYLPLVGDEPEVLPLPCCYWSTPYEELKKIVLTKSLNPESDIFFRHAHYHFGDRDALTIAIGKILDKEGIKYDFTFLHDRTEYMTKLANSACCLNVSIFADFNFRNFEAWAAGCPLLANELGAYDRYPQFKQSTVLFHRDLTNFTECLREALSLNGSRSTNFVTKSHMLMHRYVHIINNELGTRCSLTYPDIV